MASSCARGQLGAFSADVVLLMMFPVVRELALCPPRAFFVPNFNCLGTDSCGRAGEGGAPVGKFSPLIGYELHRAALAASLMMRVFSR
jgi:hypothetical protein